MNDTEMIQAKKPPIIIAKIQILECVQKHNADVRQAIVDAQKAIEHLVTSQAVAPPVQLKKQHLGSDSGRRSQFESNIK